MLFKLKKQIRCCLENNKIDKYYATLNRQLLISLITCYVISRLFMILVEQNLKITINYCGINIANYSVIIFFPPSSNVFNTILYLDLV